MWCEEIIICSHFLSRALSRSEQQARFQREQGVRLDLHGARRRSDVGVSLVLVRSAGPIGAINQLLFSAITISRIAGSACPSSHHSGGHGGGRSGRRGGFGGRLRRLGAEKKKKKDEQTQIETIEKKNS